MKRLIKFIVVTIVVIVALVGVLAVALPLLFDPNDYREQIAAQIESRTGRSASIDGELEVSVLPWLGVRTGRITLGNAPGFGDSPFATLDAAQVRVKLLPLLSREVEMDTVIVRGLSLNLSRKADGSSNWDDLTSGGGTSDGARSGALAAFALGGVTLTDASIHYDDALAGRTTKLSGLNARTGAISLSDPIDTEIGFAFESSAPKTTGQVEGTTRIAVDFKTRRITLEDLDLGVTADAPEVSPATINASARGALSYDPSSEHLTTRDLELTVNGTPPPASGLAPLELSAFADIDLRLAEDTLAMRKLRVQSKQVSRGEMTASVDARTALVMDLASQRIALKGLNAKGEASGGALGASPVAYSLMGDALWDPAGQLDLSKLSAELGDAKATGELALGNLFTSPTMKGAVVAPPLAIRPLLALAGIEVPPMRDPNALGSVGVNASFQTSENALEVSSLELLLDGQRITGTLSSPDLARGALRFDLDTGALDVDRYLPPATPGPPPVAIGALPVEVIRGLDVKGRLKASTLVYSGLRLSNVRFGVDAGNGVLALTPLSAQIAGGSYAGNIRVDARGERPTISIDEKIAKMDLHSVLKTLGVRLANVDLRDGRSDLSLKATLNASADGKRISARKVALNGRLGGRSLPRGALDLDFNGDLDADLAAGKVNIPRMVAKVANLSASGAVALSGLNATPSYKATLKVKAFNPRTFAQRFGLPVPRFHDKRALTSLAFDGTLAGSSDRISASPMTLTLDGSTAKGTLAVSDFRRPAITFDLDVNRFNADRYLPPKARGKAATPGAVATVIPVELIRLLNLNGTLDIADLRVSGLRMKGVRITAKAANGQLALSPLGASLYGGRYDGNVRVDARQANARIDVDEHVQGIRIGQLLRALRGNTPITGTADVRAVLSASGRDTKALTRTLSGDVDFAVNDGTLKRVDMVRSMCAALATIDFDKLNKKTLAAGLANLFLQSQRKSRGAATAGGEDTQFTRLAGRARITNGVARNDNLVMTSPVVRVNGAGSVDLPNERVDFDANAELTQDCAGIGKRDLAGQIIPVKITGSLHDPKVQTSVPVGLIRALTRRRSQQSAQQPSSQPAPQTSEGLPSYRSPIGTPSGQTAEQQQPAPPAQPKKRGHIIKEQRDELLKGILGNILKQQ